MIKMPDQMSNDIRCYKFNLIKNFFLLKIAEHSIKIL